MRVSTSGSFNQGLSLMQRLQSALDQTQRQISSGRRILTPSDDPIGSARALEFRESIGRLEQFDRNANIANNRLSQEESALKSVNNVLQRVRELALQANNATQSNETRALIASEVRERLDELVQLANQEDGNGEYLFSGNLSTVRPVTMTGGNFSYNGDQGQRFVQIGEGRQVAVGDSGASVFFAVREGNGDFTTTPGSSNTGTGILSVGSVVDPTVWDQGQYTVRFIDGANYEVLDSTPVVISAGNFSSGDTISFQGIEFALDGQPAAGDDFDVNPSRSQSVFDSVNDLINTLDTNVVDDVSQTALSNNINSALLNIDQAIGQVIDVRTQVGSRLAAIDSQVDANGAFALNYRDTLASIDDLDYAEALSRLALQATTLEAAQKSFVRTQSLSLFNYF